MATLNNLDNESAMTMANELKSKKKYSNINDLNSFEYVYGNRFLDFYIHGYSLVFVTKPQLFIAPDPPANQNESPEQFLAYQNMYKDPIFIPYLTKNSTNADGIIIRQLSYFDNSVYPNYTKSNFIPIFTNHAKNFAPTDVTMDQFDVYDTKEGYKIFEPSFTTVSKSANTLSFNVEDTKDISILKLIQLWVQYISNISDGTFTANPEMIRQRIYDYMCSIYYFTFDPDGETLKYWAKYTGCWPTAIPYSIFEYSKGDTGITDIGLSFNYTIKEDMNIEILRDFNRVSLNSGLLSKSSTDSSDPFYSTLYDSGYSIKEDKLLNLDFLSSKISNSSVNPIIYAKQLSGTDPNTIGSSFKIYFPKADEQSLIYASRYTGYNTSGKIYNNYFNFNFEQED